MNAEIQSLDAKQESNAEHIWHVWINKRQSELRAADPEHHHEHTLYEFKGLLQFLRYGHNSLKEAFEGKLREKHQQCSRQLPVPILNNKLSCCLGKEVTTCNILLSLKATFEQEHQRVYPFNGKKAYESLPADALYILMSRTCGWHIYKESCGATEGWHGIDSSEGYLMDVSDRMFWDRVYRSMSTDPVL